LPWCFKEFEHLEIFKTNNRGWGLRATKPIPKNEYFTTYLGNIKYGALPHSNPYVMKFHEFVYIDAQNQSSLGRFANHSCSPNSKVVKMFWGNFPFIGIQAMERIKVGQEITINYGSDYYFVSFIFKLFNWYRLWIVGKSWALKFKHIFVCCIKIWMCLQF